MSENRDKWNTEKLIGLGLVTALAFGANLIAEARKSPAKRADEAANLRKHHHDKSAYDDRRHAAWELDNAHWQAFLDDKAASNAFAADYFIPVKVVPASGTVEQSHGGSMWDTWDKYIVTSRDGRLSLTRRHDGKYLIVELETADGAYQHEGSYDARNLLIGKCDGTPTAAQRKIASLIGVLQAKGLLQGLSPVAVFEDYWQLRYAHYARFAAARGWPTEKDGEVIRVKKEYDGRSKAG